VIRKRLGRFATVFTAATMALMLVGVGTATAATPGWKLSNAVPILESVGPGKDAGFTVTLVNDGPGNIATLYLKADKEASYVSDTVHCTTSPTLYCNLGAQNVGQTIVLTVAFEVGSAGTFTVNFSESANGFTEADGPKGKSRGDINPFSASVTVTTGGGDFDGGYNVDDDTYATNPSVGRNNKQATTLEDGPDLVAVTIQDGVTEYTCQSTVTQCSRLIGEWSVLHVGDGTVGPMKVTVLIYGNAVSGNPALGDLGLVHTSDAGVTTFIHDQCTYDTNGDVENADCLAGLPTKVGKNYQIVAWLATNGGIRGGF
jgi:hypothetical protein